MGSTNNNLPNIFLFIIDALREDYSKVIENNLKQYGFNTYKNVISTSPWTIPSHASIISGLYPLYHGAHENKNKKVPSIKLINRKESLPEILSKKGYHTNLLTANAFILPEFGFNGFDDIYCTPAYSSKINKNDKKLIIKIKNKYKPTNNFQYLISFFKEKTLMLLLKLLLQQINFKFYKLIYKWPIDKGSTHIIKKIKDIEIKDKPIFIFSNLLEVHEPYNTEKNTIYNPIDLIEGLNNFDTIEKWQEGYKNQVNYINKQLSNIIKILIDKNLFDNTLFIITSDHGQLLGEHGNKLSHGVHLYDELLRVPLFIKYPSCLNIKKYENISDRYISLSKIFSFILNIINEKVDSDDILYSDTVFSESFGTQYGTDKKNLKNIDHLEKYRIAIYNEHLKGIFNVDNYEFEEIKSYNNDYLITSEDEIELKKKMINYLNNMIAIRKIRF